MLISKEKKAVIFKLKSPSRITTVIPTAKIVQHNGYPLVAVKHAPDETRVLRNLGFEVPAPMPIHYGWPLLSGRHKPFNAQEETASFLTMYDRAFCLNSMGLGKTATALWAFDYLRICKQINKMLVVCPLSTMEDTWAKEVFRTFPHLDTQVLYGTRDKRLKLLKQDADIYIINTDGLEAIANALEKRPDIDLIVIDEMALYRNASTNRWKTMNKVVNKQCRRKAWALTGAPTPHEPTDAWAQCRIMYPDSVKVPKYYTKFRELVMRQVTQFKWLPKDNALDVVFDMMQPAIRFKLDDCVDLPEQTFTSREVEMTPEQKAAYNGMLAKLKAEYAGGEILAVNEAVKANKLLQIGLGVAYGPDGSTVVLPCQPRIDALREIIEQSEGKVLVFIPLTGALEHVAEQLRREWEVAVIHGGTPKNQRDQIFADFQNAPSPHVLVANPGTMSHGLTLTAATTLVWYAPITSNDTYVQACARVRRPGQTRTTVICHIVGSEMERRMYERLQKKQKLQNVLLDMLQEGDKNG
jgi:SNF2 family DNA or RNA helicase